MQDGTTAPAGSVDDIVGTAIADFLTSIAAAVPRLLEGLVFLVLAAVVVKLVMVVVRALLGRVLPGDSPVYRQFVSTLVLAFLSFAVLLSFLSIVGLDAIAASLGTATGFVALGVSYALSDMIEDAVAGVYLLRDEDFMPGDEVKVGDVEGRVKSIELRKTRFTVDGDTVVRANGGVEKQWTKRDDQT